MTMTSHRECRAERMRCRSLVLQWQPLFRQEDDERQLVVIGRLLGVLAQKMLQRLNGKSVYFRKLSSPLKANKLEARSMKLHMHSGIMATHWQEWNCMTLERRSEYQYKPIAAQEDVRQSVRVLEENFMLERSSVPQKLEDNQGTRLSIMRLTSARLSATEKDRLRDLFHGATSSRSRVTNLRKTAQAKLMPPDILYMRVFGSFQNDRAFRQAASVAFHRCAQERLFSLADESCESVYAKYVFARQHDPMLAVLVKLCVEFDAQLDPRLCAREQLDAEPWHY